MAFINYILIFLVSTVIFEFVSSERSQITRARIESCRGCSLNRLPEVKKFIFEDVPLYPKVEFKPISGAVPELILLNDQYEEIERLQLSRLNRQECNDLLVSKGFEKDEKMNGTTMEDLDEYIETGSSLI